MSIGPVTDYIHTNAELFTAIEAQLDTYADWDVFKYYGTAISDIFRQLPQLKLAKPAAVIAYERSRYYDNRQRRNMWFHIVVVMRAPKDPWTEGFLGVSPYVNKAIELLDWRMIETDAKCEVVSDDALDFGPGLAASDILFIVKDH